MFCFRPLFQKTGPKRISGKSSFEGGRELITPADDCIPENHSLLFYSQCYLFFFSSCHPPAPFKGGLKGMHVKVSALSEFRAL